MTTCPFCNRDPFHYVDVGVGSVPVAVDCCELGDLYFRGARPELTEDVMIAPDEFREIGQRLSAMRRDIDSRTDERLADRLEKIAAAKSVTTPLGWAHPDCADLARAARILRGQPYIDTPQNVEGVLST